MADAEKKDTKKKKPTPRKKAHLEPLDLDSIPVLVMTDQEISDYMKREMARIMERAGLDSIRICSTSMRDGSTHYFTVGQGNIYAQVGAVQEWMSDLGGPMIGGGLLGGHPGDLEDDDED